MDSTEVVAIMNPQVVVVDPDLGASDAVELMREQRLSCLVVCEKGVPVGILSERDLVRVLSQTWKEGEGPPRQVRDLMSHPVFTINESDQISTAMQSLERRGIRRAPVVGDDGVLAGIITQGDLLRAHVHSVEGQRDQLKKRVVERTRELMDANKHLRTLSYEDPLLEIGNRRAMVIMLDEIHEICQRYGHIYSLVMVDLDHFKAYNDLYGHPAGDRVLQQATTAIRQSLRRADCLYRYGGEELLVLLPETDVTGGAGAAERFRVAVEDLAIPHAGPAGRVVTVSCGVSSSNHRHRFAEDWNVVLASADAALYEAKNSGRNCLRLCETHSP